MWRRTCAHQRAQHHQYKENLVGMVIAVKGGPCTGKTTLARALAKSLRCTLVSHEDIRSCTSDTERLLSSCPSTDTPPDDHLNDLSYEVLWRVAETHLGLHHSVVIDSSLRTRAHLERFLALSSSKHKDIDVVPIIIECWAKNESERRHRLSKTYSAEETERIIEEADDGTYDTGKIPKLIIDTTSHLGIEEHGRTMESFILSCLDKKLYGERPIIELSHGCTSCKTAYVEKITAHLPATVKHQCHDHELVLKNNARPHAQGRPFWYRCGSCGCRGRNLHYTCVHDSCKLYVHAKCALNLPLTFTAPFHYWHPPLELTYRPLDPEQCYCDRCEEERYPEDWIYFCKECEYHVHIECAYREFFESPDLVQY